MSRLKICHPHLAQVPIYVQYMYVSIRARSETDLPQLLEDALPSLLSWVEFLSAILVCHLSMQSEEISGGLEKFSATGL